VGNLRSRGPASVQICVMLRKPAAVQMDVQVAYTGFDIANEFVVGYGLDYGERYRNLPFIGTLAPHVYGGSEDAPGPEAGSAGAGAPLPGEHDAR
jgi:hypoxanthine phosphoribosyltransferase